MPQVLVLLRSFVWALSVLGPVSIPRAGPHIGPAWARGPFLRHSVKVGGGQDHTVTTRLPGAHPVTMQTQGTVHV